MTKKRVLILCTGNSCRSQMAEGWWKHLGGERWDVFSAGVHPIGVNPLTISTMAEAGVDISGQTSDAMSDYANQPFDLVVTVCANAENRCPAFPNAARREHWPFDDPYYAAGGEEQVMGEFRRVRDEIGSAIRHYLQRDTEQRS
jgi:arsenate reductase